MLQDERPAGRSIFRTPPASLIFRSSPSATLPDLVSKHLTSVQVYPDRAGQAGAHGCGQERAGHVASGVTARRRPGCDQKRL